MKSTVPSPVEWTGDGLRILDQRLLPKDEVYLECSDATQVADAIRGLAVRGAPILGVSAAYALAMAARASDTEDPRRVLRDLRLVARMLRATRPTAVNISWAVREVTRAVRGLPTAELIRSVAFQTAERLESDDKTSCAEIGRFGLGLVPDRANILTHCNTGRLCTAGIGTALGVVYAAHGSGKRVHVWVGETRPVLQGARLTAWELQRAEVPMTLVADTVPGSLMAAGKIDLVIVGADRITTNGDVANKIGTYQLAVLAEHHDVPFYVAAPLSSVDPDAVSGDAVEIEQRDPSEVTSPMGVVFAPEGTPVANPAFDITPGALIEAIITDGGVVRPPYGSGLRRALRERMSA